MGSIERIVERQIREWQSRVKAAKEKKSGSSSVMPNITISREFGSQGALLADRLSELTGFTVWDKKLVGAVAKKTGANEEIMHSLDESRRSALEDAIRGVMMGIAYTEEEYVYNLMRVIGAVAAAGRAIIVGRGGHYILKSEQALRVRIVCPLDLRAEKYASKESVNLKSARQIVERQDRARVAFIRQNYKRDLTNPSDYDIVLNSATLPLDGAIKLVVEAFEAKFGQRPA